MRSFNDLTPEEASSFVNSLPDDQVKAWQTRGVEGLDPDHFNHLTYLLNQPDPSQQVRSAPIYNIKGIDPSLATNPVSKLLSGNLPYADWTVPVADWIRNNAANPLKQSANEAEQDLGGIPGKAIGMAGRLGASMIPQTPGQVKLQLAAPISAEGLSQVAGAAADTQIGQKIIEMGSNVVQGLSKLPANLVHKVINDPEILNRYLPIDQAGELMSNVLSKLGLKSGSEALAASGASSKAVPIMGDFANLANETIQKVKNAPQVEQEMATIENQIRDFGAGVEHTSELRDKAVQKYKDLQDQLPNLQDEIASRQYMSKMMQKQTMQSAENQVVQPLAQQNLDLLDNHIDNEMARLAKQKDIDISENVPGYGKVTNLDQLRNIYHEAKIGEAFSSLVPQNRNGQADALRVTLGLLSKNPMAAFESPLLYKKVIQGLSALGNPLTAVKTAVGLTGLENEGNQ